MNERQTKLYKLLETTPVLSPEEKEEWRGLLPLMNDKQMNDLEDLLRIPGQPAYEEPKPIQKQSSPPKMVSTKMPMDTSYINTDPRVEQKRPVPPKPLYQPAPKVLPVIPEPKPVIQEEQPTIPKQSVLLYKQQPPAQSTTGSLPETVGLPSTAREVSSLSVLALRAQNFPALVQRLKELAGSWGYFNLYLLIQKSPLFEAYVRHGSRQLDHQEDNVITQEEFETITDLLIQIKTP